MLNDVAGKPLRAWDSRGHAFRTEYDALRRPLRQFVRGHDAQDPTAELLVGRTEYGEGEPGDVAEQPARAGRAGLRRRRRRHQRGLRLQGQPAARPAGSSPRTTERIPTGPASRRSSREQFDSSTTYDALNRPVTVTTPDGSVMRPAYNEASLLERVGRQPARRGRRPPSSSPTSTTTPRASATRSTTATACAPTYGYDPMTFRLMQLSTTRTVRRMSGPCRTCPTPTTRSATSPTSATTRSRRSTSTTRSSSRTPTTPTTRSIG